jgi:hypothetical protein
MLQNLVVGIVVALCAVYAAWTLMPASWRRATAGRLARLPAPARLRAHWQRLAQSAPGCGCNGCDAGAPGAAKKPGDAQPVQFIRKVR